MGVFDGAAVGAGAFDLERFAGHGGGQDFVEVVTCAFEILLIGGGLVVDGSLIDELAGGVDDEDVRGGLGSVGRPMVPSGSSRAAVGAACMVLR